MASLPNITLIPTKEYLNEYSHRKEVHIKKHFSEFHTWMYMNYTWCSTWKEMINNYCNSIFDQPKKQSFEDYLKSAYRRQENVIKSRYPEEHAKLWLKYSWCKSWNEVMYCFDHNIISQPVCRVCGNPVRFFASNPTDNKYSEYCSTKCSTNSDEVRNKALETCRKNRGVDYPMQSEIVKQTYTDNFRNKTGMNWPGQTPEVHKKMKQTCLKRYGNKNYTNREKSKQTCLERYGNKNYTNREKSKQTCLERYGVECYCITKECRDAINNDSKPNRDFATLLTPMIYNREFTLGKYSYDFKVDNTLIEINPTPTHNSTWGLFNNPKEPDYHLNKTKTAELSGYQCIHIWDWDEPLKVIQLITPKETIYARKCSIKEITAKEANEFLNQYHLQGRCNGQKICIGIFDDNLIGLMTFGKPRYNKKFQWELLRLCFSKNVVGGSERLFKYFINHYNPESIISYCDKSKFSGAVYKRLGFTLKSTSRPTKHWYNIKTKQHITDNLLRQRGYDQLFDENYGKGTSNEQLMLEHGFVEVYDCGQDSYIYHK